MLLGMISQAGLMGPIDFIAMILGKFIEWIYEFLTMFGIHNAALSIIIFTVIVYAFMIPMNYKQQKSQKLMNVVQPEIQKITDKYKGKLREEVNEMGYTSSIIPDDIGGRYSFITPAHLLPLAVNYNIDKIIDGYYHGKRLLDVAYEYAATRYLLYKHGKVVENFTVSEENMSYFSEWLKQLFGETEGKNGVGILPTSTVFTRDLHSLGQFIQEGNKILFETYAL